MTDRDLGYWHTRALTAERALENASALIARHETAYDTVAAGLAECERLVTEAREAFARREAEWAGLENDLAVAVHEASQARQNLAACQVALRGREATIDALRAAQVAWQALRAAVRPLVTATSEPLSRAQLANIRQAAVRLAAEEGN